MSEIEFTPFPFLKGLLNFLSYEKRRRTLFLASPFRKRRLMMSLSDFWDKVTPPKTLTHNLKSSEVKQLKLIQNRHGVIKLSDSKDKEYQLKKITMLLSEKDKHKISEGAVAGAFAAALMDKDVLTGALIGDWWEKQRDNQSRQVIIELTEVETKEVRKISLRLKRQQYQQIRCFFNLI